MAKIVHILHSVEMEALAEEVCESLNGGVIDFIMYIDAYMADTSFTEELVERLEAALLEDA